MAPTLRIKRFTLVDRLFHLALMLTFLIQAATGLSRMFFTTTWGSWLGTLFGGYESCLVVHQLVGVLMIIGFLIHTLLLLSRIKWSRLGTSLFGPDSLLPRLQDFKDLWQRLLWFVGLRPHPKMERWAYWEKFDYWAVYWGLPLLAITGFMLMYPLLTSRYLPGWSLNVAALLHRAEAILALVYIFVVHFFIGHLRPTSFPMNEAMFTGSMTLDEAMEEKPAWVERLKTEGRLETGTAPAPAVWYRVLYFIFGYTALGVGVYLLVNGIMYAPYIRLH